MKDLVAGYGKVAGTVKDPINKGEGQAYAVRVVRGGSWDTRPLHSMSVWRFGHPPDELAAEMGFRVVRAAD